MKYAKQKPLLATTEKVMFANSNLLNLQLPAGGLLR